MTRVEAIGGAAARRLPAWAWTVRVAAAATLAATVASAAALAGGAPPSPHTLRVGTSGDYAPFSFDPAGPAPLDGFDVALARAYAAERGLRLELVRFAWPELERRLAAGEFDVAMSGVTVRPERSLLGRFSAPVAESGAVALLRVSAAPGSLDALDRPGITLAVNAGGHLERATRARFPAATVRALPDNAAVLHELVSGRADAAVSDTLEAPAWIAKAPDLALLGPFTRDRKAWLVRADAATLAADLDAWLAAREADGTLATLRARWLGAAASGPTAAPLPALLAAMDERFALMPFVAEAKRGWGRPVKDAAQEERVLAAAIADVARAAAAANRPPRTAECVRGLHEAQMDAGIAIQQALLAGPPALASAPPDLDAVTRPALARISVRIAGPLVSLDPPPDEEAFLHEVREGLRAPGLDAARREAIGEALLHCVRGGGP